MTRSAPLDGLRGLAILMVVSQHYLVGQPLGWVSRVLSVGWSGVDLFFVLSGYLIAGILLDHRDSPNLLRVFYLRRACRILPLYYGILLAYFVVIHSPLWHLPGFNTVFDPHQKFAPYLFYYQNFTELLTNTQFSPVLGVTWSLAVEEQFYFVIPIVILVLPRRWVAILMVAGLIAAPIYRAQCEGVELFIGSFCRMDGLCWGVLLALITRTRLWETRDYLGVAAAFWLTLTWVSHVIFQEPPSEITTSLYAYSYVLLVAFVVGSPDSWVARMLSAKCLTHLGTISYGIYLFHQPVQFEWAYLTGVTHINTAGDWVLPVGAFVITVALAQLSYWVVERRCVGWGRRVQYKQKPAAPPLDGSDGP